MRSAMLAPSLPLPALIASLPSAESSVWLPALHHLLAIRVQRIVNNPLGCIDFVVVPKIQSANPSAMAFSPAPSGCCHNVLSVPAPFTILLSNTSAGSAARLYFFRIASNEHSLP
jgi:hypothetical protein